MAMRKLVIFDNNYKLCSMTWTFLMAVRAPFLPLSGCQTRQKKSTGMKAPIIWHSTGSMAYLILQLVRSSMPLGAVILPSIRRQRAIVPIAAPSSKAFNKKWAS